ncbi:membrane protein insertase YidC [Priestia megaterium]|uniref:membrane protein insertase YidC n=1 Tax=Priestia megaterium TaxID=1404 RepID=UPI0011A34B12|nr:membrane protein insertase YidC [Priestia megaterium]MCM3016476.1 membrane protein insertase YidC [Priestia megaterium]
MLKHKKKLFFIFVSIFLLAGCDSSNVIQSSHTHFFDHYFIYPFSLLILFIGNTWLHQSIGFSIMLVTVGVRMLLAPLNILQYKNQLSNKRIQPQLQELKEKYKDKDHESQQQYQREMMKLLKENGANPLMGCLPLFVQLPVFSIVYYAIRRIDEISASSFLWLDLGHADPYFILPIAAAVATYLQSKVMQSDVEGMNQSHAVLSRILSPLMVLSFGIFSPSGLVLYWMTGSLFMIFQSFVLKKIFQEKVALEAK